MVPPLVSVIIPTYNRSHLIRESIQSVFDQTYKHWELIIVDDGSTDETSQVIARYSDPRIYYYRINHTGVIGQVRNHGMKRSHGEYIAFLDSDDLWRKDKLEFQLSLLHDHPKAHFIFSNGIEFGDNVVTQRNCEDLFVGSIFLPIVLEGRFCFLVPSLLFNREVIEKTGWIDEKLQSGGDIDFFFRMGCLFQGVFTNERLVKIRKHFQSTSNELEVIAYQEHIKTLGRCYDQKWLNPQQYNSVVSALYYKMGVVLLKRKRSKEALLSFTKYNFMAPLNWKGWCRLFQSAFFALRHA